MGRKAVFTRARFQEVRQKREQRTQRSKQQRDQRHGVDKSERLIERTVVQRPLPTDDQQALLFEQFSQACRLPAASSDLCLLMRHYTKAAGEASSPEEAAAATSGETTKKNCKRQRDGDDGVAKGTTALNTMADILLQTQITPAAVEEEGVAAEGDDLNDDDDVLTVMQDILQDDSGRRVVSTLLASLHSIGSPKCELVAKAVLEQFEENEHLPSHHVACRIMSALVQFGSVCIRGGVLDLLRQRSITAEAVEALLSDRHTAGTVLALLKYHRPATSAWLCEMLSLMGNGTAKSEKGSKKAAKNATAKSAESEQVSTEKLMELINGPVAGPVLSQLITVETRRMFLQRLSLSDLLQSKRGNSFLTQMLSIVPTDTEASSSDIAKEAKETADALLQQIGGDLHAMATDRRANFVVQSVIQLLPVMTPDKGGEHLTQLVRLLGGASGLQEMAVHGNGVHVVLALVDTVLQMSPDILIDDVADQLISRQNVNEMMNHHQGNLVIRHLMPLIARKTSKAGQLIKGVVDYNLSSLVHSETGNLVVQAFLRALGKIGASQVAQKLVSQDELLPMCHSPYASHVVFVLFELVDPTTHTLLCNTLKPQVLRLSTHINGRFIVEKIIAASREVREEMARQFLSLAQERGTQHLLCCLVASMDPRSKQQCIDRVLLPHLVDLATHQYGSIVLQKLMQAEPAVLQAVQKQLASNTHVRSDLAQNFFGKFVVQISQNS